MEKQLNSPTLQKFRSVAMLKQYQLPGDPERDIYVVGISGGADSTALAILLKTLFPAHPFRYVFTDTKAEAEGTEEAIRNFEEFAGVKVERIHDDEGLWGLIARFGGYLPSGQARWCTRILKAEQYEDFMDNIRGDREDILVHSFVGLRADEPGRNGLDSSMPWMRSHFPMRDLGLVREDVFKILEETVGIPSFYTFRSRSGCAACWAMRPSEMLGSMARYPDAMAKAESVEFLTPEDIERYNFEGQDLSGAMMSYPVPADLLLYHQMRERRGDQSIQGQASRKVEDLFGSVTRVYIGVEFLQDPLIEQLHPKDRSLSTGHGCWFHSLIGWSTSRGGIARKLNVHYTTRLDTAEVFGLSQEEFQAQYKQAVYLLEIPSHLVDLGAPACTEKEPDGRLVDAGGNSLLVNGSPVYLRRKKFSKAERAALRSEGRHHHAEWELIDRHGEKIEAPFTDDSLFAEPVALGQLKTAKHTEALQQVLGPAGQVLLGGARVYREKKGKILKQGSFTWRKGEPLAQIRQVATMVKRTMTIEGLRQEEKDYAPFRDEVSWEAERYEAVVETLKQVDYEHGAIVGMEAFTPRESRKVSSPDDEPCFACSK